MATSATSASTGPTATGGTVAGAGTTANSAGGHSGSSGTTGASVTGGKSGSGCTVAGIDRRATRWVRCWRWAQWWRRSFGASSAVAIARRNAVVAPESVSSCWVCCGYLLVSGNLLGLGDQAGDASTEVRRRRLGRPSGTRSPSACRGRARTARGCGRDWQGGDAGSGQGSQSRPWVRDPGSVGRLGLGLDLPD